MDLAALWESANECSAPNEDREAPTEVATRPLWVLEVEKQSGEDKKGRIISHKVIST